MGSPRESPEWMRTASGPVGHSPSASLVHAGLAIASSPRQVVLVLEHVQVQIFGSVERASLC